MREKTDFFVLKLNLIINSSQFLSLQQQDYFSEKVNAKEKKNDEKISKSNDSFKIHLKSINARRETHFIFQ